MQSTQTFLQFDHIRDGVVVLRGGDLRAILEVQPVNFGLKSQEEQDALTYAFQGFLNSLDFDLQILVHSRRVNIDPYLKDLEARAAAQENELLKNQTEEYVEFIRSFIAEANAMKKEFYLVVPYASLAAKRRSGGLLSALPSLLPHGAGTSVRMGEGEFMTARTQLLQRVAFVAQTLQQVGLEATMLATHDLVDLLWRLYNREAEDAGGSPAVSEEALAAEEGNA